VWCPSSGALLTNYPGPDPDRLYCIQCTTKNSTIANDIMWSCVICTIVLRFGEKKNNVGSLWYMLVAWNYAVYAPRNNFMSYCISFTLGPYLRFLKQVLQIRRQDSATQIISFVLFLIIFRVLVICGMRKVICGTKSAEVGCGTVGILRNDRPSDR